MPLPTTTSRGRRSRPRGDGEREDANRAPRPALPGLAARQCAVSVLEAVLHDGRTLDDAFAAAVAGRPGAEPLAPRDRAFARLIAATVLRRHGEFTAVIRSFLDKPLPKSRSRISLILLSGAAQLLALGTPRHAAVSLAVEQCRADRSAQRFDRLANALLRRVAAEGSRRLQALDAVRVNVPDWLFSRWQAAYGEPVARRIAEASLCEAPLDLSVKSAPEAWASRLGGVVLPTGSVRLAASGRIEGLPGYADGEWWVQDAAAALPARLLGDVAGLKIADLCAAPGGKTAELAAAGAVVTAVDMSQERLARLTANLERLKLMAEAVAADASAWAPGRLFDAVLLDVPCSATGTIRRHPDILHLKREADLTALVALQARLLANAAKLVEPGGRLVYAACSLEPEECSEQVGRFLKGHPEFARIAIVPGEGGAEADWITPAGDLRTLPFHMALDQPALSGIDGFFAARMRRAL